MSDGIIGSVGVAVVPDAQDFWRRFQEQTRAGAGEAGRRAGNDWRRGFDSETSRPAVLPVRADTTQLRTELTRLRSQFNNLGDIRIDTGALRASDVAALTAATNRLTDAQTRLRDARRTLAATTAKEGVTEEELAHAHEAVSRAERDQELATLRLAAAQESVAAAQARARDQAEKQAGALKTQTVASQGLLSSLLSLAPAIVPLAGAAALGGAALVEMGAAGALAIKGIQADLKAANADGVAFAAGLGVLKTDLHSLEQTSAHNVLGAFQQVTAKLHADMPSVNNDLAQSSKVLGDIGGHVVGGLIGGLHNFSPALLQIEQGVDGVAAKFEAWATGSGGAKFGAALIEDFQHVEPLLENLTTAIAHVVAASNGPGLAIVDELNVFAKILASIPTPALSALATGIVSLRIASTVSTAMGKLASSIRDVEDAESGAGGETSGFRGRLGAAVDTVGKLAAGWVAASVAVGAVDNATKSWATSTSDLAYGTHYVLGTFDDLLKLNFKGFWGDITGTGAAKQAAEMRGHVLAIDAAIKLLNRDADKATTANLFVKGNHYGYTTDTGNFDPNQVAQTNATRVASQEAKTYQAAIRGLMATLSQFYREVSGEPLSQAAQAYSQQATAIDKSDQSLQKFLTSGQKSSYTYKGITVGIGAWDAALAKTNNDTAAAEGVINGQVDALLKQKGLYGDLTQGSLRIGEAVAAAGAKYQLTTDQVDTYAAALGISADMVANGVVTEKQFVAAIGEAAHALSNGNTAIAGWVQAIATFDKSADTAADRATLIGQALRAANGDTLDYANTMVQAATANQQMVTDFHNLKSGVLNLKTGVIDFHNAAAAPLLGDLQNLQTAAMNAAAATYQHYNALGDAAAADKAFNVYVNDTQGALEGQASQLGLTKDQAKKLATEYFGIKNSGDLKKQIELIGQDKVLTALKGILEDLDILAGKHVTTYVDTVYRTKGQGTKISDPKLAAADGMIVTAGTGPRADDVLVRVSKGEAIIPADQTAKHMGMVKALISRTQGFADGGVIGNPSNPFTGVDYSGNANKNGVVKKSGSKGNGPTYVVAGQQYTTLRSAENAARRIFKADVTLGVTIDDKDLTSFKSAIKGTVQQAQAAAQKIDADLAKLGASKTLRINLRNANADMDKIIADRNAKVDQLKTVTAEWTQVRDSVAQAGTGAYDISSAGTGFNGQQAVTFGSMQAQELQALNTVKAWGAGIRRLATLFGKSTTGRAMVQDLAEKGPSDLPQVQALLSASPKDLTNFVSTQNQINAVSNSLGGFIASNTYGAQISKLQGQIRLDDGSITRMASHIEKAVENAVKALAHRPIVVTVNDKVVARAAASGTKKVSR